MSGATQEAANANTAAEDETNDDFDADFEAGFSGSDKPTETPAPAPQPAQAQAPNPEPTPAPTEAPKYIQITEDEWNATKSRAAKVDEIHATLDQRFNTAFGKMGGLERTLQKLQADTPAGQAIVLDEADFEDLKREMPDVAELTLKGLNKVFAKLKGTKGADPEAVEKLLTERLTTAIADVRKETVTASLEAVFPGWEEDVNTPQFATWIKAQAADVQALANSDKVRDAAKMLRLFNEHKNAPAPTPAPTAAPTPAPVSTRQRQIAAAVAPKGEGGHPPARTEDDEFESGFNYRSRSG